MHRIDHATKAPDANGVGKPGFTEGDPNTQTPATVITATWLNAVQEEIAQAIEAFGATLQPGNSGQLAAVLAELGGDLFTTEHAWLARQRFTSGYIANHWGVSGEVLYVENADGQPQAKERTIYLPLADARPAENSVWTMGSSGYADGTVTNDPLSSPGASTLRWELRVPVDSRVTRIRAYCAARDAAMTLWAGRKRFGETRDFTYNYLATSHTAGAGAGINAFTTLELNGDLAFAATDVLSLWLRATTGGQLVYWVAVTVQDAGPRSF